MVTIAEITALLQDVDRDRLEVLERSFAADTRKGVRNALAAARRRVEHDEQERQRVLALYDFEQALAEKAGATTVVGLDEVGRGPLAGPLAVGAVVLPADPLVPFLNDSKQVTPVHREQAADVIRRIALACAVVYVEPQTIDDIGMTAALKQAFRQAVVAIESQGVEPDLIALDGNPLHFDPREVNVVKGDSLCASIAAASLLAKVERDALMVELDERYPQYGFRHNKGYGSADHRDAIVRYGLCDAHRRTFCTGLMQQSLF